MSPVVFGAGCIVALGAGGAARVAYDAWLKRYGPNVVLVGEDHGVVVCIQHGLRRKRVAGVGYVRRHSNNPSNSFEEQLEKEIDKACAVIDPARDA